MGKITRKHDDQLPLSVAIVGVGAVAETIHIPILTHFRGVKVQALVDPYAPKDRLDRLAKQLDCSWQRNLDSLNVDLVLVSTPISTHFELAKSLISRGMHVFVEKPLVPSLEQADELIDLATRHAVRVFCGHVRRFYENTTIARGVLTAGMIGRIQRVAIFEGNLYGWKRRYFAEGRDRNTSIDEGVLFDVGSHSIDTMMYVLHDSNPTVTIHKGRTDDMNLQSNIEVVGEIAFPVSGETAALSVRLSNSIALANCIWFEGTVGRLMLSTNGALMPRFFPRDHSEPFSIQWTSPRDEDPFVRQLDVAFKGVCSGEPTIIDAKCIRATIAVLEDINRHLEPAEIPWA
jgi:predicted dehydrogenase